MCYEKELIQFNRIKRSIIAGRPIKKIKADFADLNFLNLYKLDHF
jgi:hypothetical protein